MVSESLNNKMTVLGLIKFFRFGPGLTLVV